jgi:RNA polymerase sigma-70 factor (ECF subfamily)
MPDPQRHLLHESFGEFEDELRRFLIWKVGEDDAPDLLQEVCLRALESTDLGAVKNLRAFMFRIAGNLVIDTYRRRQTRAGHLVAPPPELDELQGDAPGPEAVLEGQAELVRILKLLRDLPAACRHAFLLNRVDGLTHAQIAERFGISRKSVERHIQRALLHCMSGLEP